MTDKSESLADELDALYQKLAIKKYGPKMGKHKELINHIKKDANNSGLLADWQIAVLCLTEKPMIKPFYLESVNRTDAGAKIPSKGLCSYGYDITLASDDLKVFTSVHCNEIDPRNINPSIYTKPVIHHDEKDGAAYVSLPPNGFLLGHTVEWFDMPNDLLGVCLGKSTYARGGVSVIVTPLESGWDGNLVVEVVNNTTLPVRIYVDAGIAQINFYRGDPCLVSYADRGGKYNGQVGTQDSIV